LRRDVCAAADAKNGGLAGRDVFIENRVEVCECGIVTGKINIQKHYELTNNACP